MRDVLGLPADEVCTVLGVSEGNQVRRKVEVHLTGQAQP
jgi:hypothetical protein